jgi:hypothetical protein
MEHTFSVNCANYTLDVETLFGPPITPQLAIKGTIQRTFTDVQVVYPDWEPFWSTGEYPIARKATEKALTRLLRKQLWLR